MTCATCSRAHTIRISLTVRSSRAPLLLQQPPPPNLHSIFPALKPFTSALPQHAPPIARLHTRHERPTSGRRLLQTESHIRYARNFGKGGCPCFHKSTSIIFAFLQSTTSFFTLLTCSHRPWHKELHPWSGAEASCAIQAQQTDQQVQKVAGNSCPK